ncbi:MAG: hypothetical protein D9V47_01980 [Clostridia bacterium]|nr:MAG: hypothetical protein D9V47_01980 [Clostridia bacterium]
MEFTLDEQIVCQIARTFGPEDDFVISGTGPATFVAAALAQRLYAPRLAFYTTAFGRAAILSEVSFPFKFGQPNPDWVMATFDTEEIFSFVLGGKWCILMQPVQVDQYGYMNLSQIGDKYRPSMVFVGSRGVPENTVNGRRIYYFVPNHSKRAFVEMVDFISGVGYGPERREGWIKWGVPYRVFSNLGIFDFDPDTGRMRLAGLYQGVSLNDVVANTGFELVIPDPVPVADPPTPQELKVLRQEIDPLATRRLDFAKGEAYKKILEEIRARGGEM